VIFAEPQEHVSRINEELAAGSPQVTGMDAEGHKLATGRGNWWRANEILSFAIF
jgi:hypothetical protein